MSVPFVKLSKGGYVKIGQVGNYIILGNIIHDGDTITTNRFLPIYRGHDYATIRNSDVLTIVPENGQVSSHIMNFGTTINNSEFLNPNNLKEIQFQYVFDDTKKCLLVNDLGSEIALQTIDLNSNNLEHIARVNLGQGDCAYPLAIKISDDEYFLIYSIDYYSRAYYSARFRVNKETGSIDKIHDARHSCNECGKQILGQSQKYVLYTQNWYRQYVSLYIYDKIAKSSSELLRIGNNSYEIHSLVGSGFYQRNSENDMYIDKLFVYNLEYGDSNNILKFRKVLIDLENKNVLYNSLEPIKNVSSLGNEFNFSGSNRHLNKYQFIHKNNKTGEYFMTMVLVANSKFNRNYNQFKKIYLFKLEGINSDEDLLDNTKLPNVSLTYVKSFTLNNYLRGFLPITDDRNNLLIYTDDNVYKMSFDFETNEWIFKPLGIPNTILMLKDTYNRVWVLDKDYNIYMLTPNIPFKVEIHSEFENNEVEFNGEPIDTKLYVSVYNYEGERIKAKVKLLIVSNNAVFVLNDGSTSKEIDIETSTNSDIEVPIRIIDEGKLFLSVFAIQ
jgi:hypothetical protein